MVIDAARLALANLLAPETRKLFWKVLGITLLLLVGLWLALHGAIVAFALPWVESFFPDLPDWAGGVAFVFTIFAGAGLAFGLAFLLSPVTAVVAGLFLDDIAEVVERRDYPADRQGTAMPLVPAMIGSLKFLGVVVVGNIIALILLFVPGINLIAFFLVNGYLLGREFFEFAAMRFRSPEEARSFRAKHSTTVFLGGLIIAAFLAVPIVNLLTPLFAAAMMVHLHKLLSVRDPLFANQLRR
ncbi:sulfate transporter family protein [Rhizobium sp. BK376]|uniref:sulfate transporter family protein n=1 Tax=Rhizobium sp. BK376 TaxID=2512149 RepID=UPI00104FB57E|nr:sulfate transporter family protein [Rhizobium sp. BK376]TCR81566.1 CysZ protein [Rhizobium sp. BK376]